jgi:hypothetical protein
MQDLFPHFLLGTVKTPGRGTKAVLWIPRSWKQAHLLVGNSQRGVDSSWNLDRDCELSYIACFRCAFRGVAWKRLRICLCPDRCLDPCRPLSSSRSSSRSLSRKIKTTIGTMMKSDGDHPDPDCLISSYLLVERSYWWRGGGS